MRPKWDIISKVPKDVKGQGRKRKHEAEDHMRINWKHPLVFALIKEAQKQVSRLSYNEAWSQAAIVKQCQAKSFLLFGNLTPQVLRWWIDRSGSSPHLRADVLEEVKLNGLTPHMMSTRLGILDNHPTLKKGILKQLQST
jgi:hypothetical protein